MSKLTKTEQKKRCKLILNSKKPINSIDKAYLMSIFEQHPIFELKRGNGIKDIIIGKAQYGTKCFFLVRADGTKIDISYNVAIDREKKKYQKIAQACRTAIKPIIEEFKSNINYGIDKCPLTGEILKEFESHIDHYNLDFRFVVKNWIKLRGEEKIFKYINKNTRNDNLVEIHFTDKRVINDFIEFHNANTHLRAVTSSANLKRNKR